MRASLRVAEAIPILCFDFAVLADWLVEENQLAEAIELFDRSILNIERCLSSMDNRFSTTPDGYRLAVDRLISLVKVLEAKIPKGALERLKEKIVRLRARLEEAER